MLLMYLMMMMMQATTTTTLVNGHSVIKEMPQEYCHIEWFHPQCSKNEVILMESATYGRMRIGKCIKAKEIETLGDDPRYLGCSVDVLSLLDEQCSGKSECEIRVIDISDEKRQPCFSDLKLYLEASYRCISVADERRSCAVVASRTPIHVDISQNVCGSLSQPWTIEAPVGQKLIVSLLDLKPSESHKSHGNKCQHQGLIVDRIAQRNISLCGGGSEREKQLYKSMGNTIQIILNRETHSVEVPGKTPVLLKFEAVGCSDIIPSEDTWLKRRDDTIVIGCYSSRQTWKLTCNAGKWTGVLGNCSQDMSKKNHVTEHIEEEIKLTKQAQVLAIVSICAFTLAICFIIMCIGALCLRRYYNQHKTKSDYKTLNYESNFVKSKEISGQRMPSAFPDNCPGDGCSGFPGQHIPTYSVYLGEDHTDNRAGQPS